jgi:hypothetical protein
VFKLLRSILGICLFISTLAIQAQELKPRGFFQKDSIKVGEVVPFTFSYKDRKNRPVIFPDSLYDFSPFELVSKDYYDTQSDSINSIDSAVYYLTTFEIDLSQKLSLPVYLVANGDSLPLFSETDSIKLQEVVLQMPDSVDLAETTHYRPVSTQFNYPYFIIGLFILGFIALLVLIIWGKTIRNKIKLYRLKKKMEQFKLDFERETEKLDDHAEKPQIEGVLRSWKTFMEGLDKIPYRKLTTKEIVLIHGNKSLEETLKSIDRSIYSQMAASALQNDFEFLMDYSVDRYNHITEEIKNA